MRINPLASGPLDLELAGLLFSEGPMAEHDITILRSPKSREDPYVRVDRDTAQSGPLLRYESRGLLLYVLSKPPNWKAKHSDLMREGGIGKDALNSILKNLRECGYIERIKGRSNGGTFKWTLVVYETPELNPSVTSADNPVVVESATSDGLTSDGKPALDIYSTRAPAPGPLTDHKDQETKDVSKQTKRRAGKALPKELAIFKSITNHLPRSNLRERVITTIGPSPDITRLKACYEEWSVRAYNEHGTRWLFEWYVNDFIPERQMPYNHPDNSKTGQTLAAGARVMAKILKEEEDARQQQT